MGKLIDRFGAQAVMGRSYLGYGEISRILYVERVVHAHQQRDASENWVAWAQANPDSNHLLIEAQKATLDAAD